MEIAIMLLMTYLQKYAFYKQKRRETKGVNVKLFNMITNIE